MSGHAVHRQNVSCRCCKQNSGALQVKANQLSFCIPLSFCTLSLLDGAGQSAGSFSLPAAPMWQGTVPAPLPYKASVTRSPARFGWRAAAPLSPVKHLASCADPRAEPRRSPQPQRTAPLSLLPQKRKPELMAGQIQARQVACLRSCSHLCVFLIPTGCDCSFRTAPTLMACCSHLCRCMCLHN